MHLAKRAALAAAILFVSVGLTACKKKEKEGEKKDPVAEPDKGSGSASASGSAKPDEVKPADTALKGFKGAMAEASGKGEGGLMGKAKGSLGSSLGALFGGGAAAAAEPTAQDGDRHAMGKGQDPSAVEEGEPPPGDEGDDVKGGPGAAPAAIAFPPAGQPGGDCAAVTDRLMVVITAMMGGELGEIDAAQQTEMRTMISTMCTEQKWSQELKDCALAAMSEADLDACEKFAPADMKEDEPGDDVAYEPGEDYPAEPAKPAPAWTGGDSCKDVGDRLIQLSIAQMGELPPEALKEMETSLAEAADQVKQMCEEMKWSDSVRKCILAAPTIDDTGSCMSELTGDM